MAKYKNEKYLGVIITFIKSDGRVWAKAPSVSRHYLGVGKTKAQAFNDLKGTLGPIIRVEKKHKKTTKRRKK